MQIYKQYMCINVHTNGLPSKTITALNRQIHKLTLGRQQIII